LLGRIAQGYLYYVSFAGVTGASDRLDVQAAGSRVHALKALTAVPVVAGFGIKDAASASAMAATPMAWWSAALVAVLEGADDTADAVARAQAFLAPLRQALDTAR
jgi:tryptophan synthase alpha chain